MCGSVVLLATTNQMCQDIAAVPMLWVVPLSLYLITFILCFESDRWYIRPVWLTLLPLALACSFTALLDTDFSLKTQILCFAATVFCACMVCHGELSRLRPGPAHLTQFYLFLSAGGALGGIGVSLVAPALFDGSLGIPGGYWEFPGGLIAACLLAMLVLYREQRASVESTSIKQRYINLSLLAGGFIPAIVIVELLGTRLDAVNTWMHTFLYSRFPKGSAYKNLHVYGFAWQFISFATFALVMLAWTLPLKRRRQIMLATLGISVVAMGGIAAGLLQQFRSPDITLATARNFYGVLRVNKILGDDKKPVARSLVHGQIRHGFQYLDRVDARKPTSYYVPDSGIGVAERALIERQKTAGQLPSLRTGVIGLGTGTVAAYGRPGDYFRFYEINPDVQRLCDRYFTFIRDSRATRVDIVLGDARIMMEQEKARGEPQNLDILVVDAFSGDSIPLHLLTREAMALYAHHLKPAGVMAIHISNRYIELAPLVRGLAADRGLKTALVTVDADDENDVPQSQWVLVTADETFFQIPLVKSAIAPWPKDSGPTVLFTDDFSNLFKLMQW